MEFKWPSGFGVIVASLILLLVLLLIILHALTVPLLAWCVVGMAVAIIFR